MRPTIFLMACLLGQSAMLMAQPASYVQQNVNSNNLTGILDKYDLDQYDAVIYFKEKEPPKDLTPKGVLSATAYSNEGVNNRTFRTQESFQRSQVYHPDADADFDEDQFFKNGLSVKRTTPSRARPASYYSSAFYQRADQETPTSTITLVTSVYHQTKKNDTLWSIAQQYKTTVPALKQLNQLESDEIRMNMMLQVK